MQNRRNLVLVALAALITMAPAFGMFTSLKRSLMGSQVRNAAYGTLAARLLRSNSTFTQGFKVAQRPAMAQVQPATKSTVGFFGKLFASLPVIGWFWKSDEEQVAQEILRYPTMKESLTTLNWNPNHPIVADEVYEHCRKNKKNEHECGLLYNRVKEQLSKERLSALDILNTKNRTNRFSKEEELRLNINVLAGKFTKAAMRGQIDTNVSVAQASDNQLQRILDSAIEKDFDKCNRDKDIHQNLCKPAQELSFKRLQAFRDAVQGKTPAAPQATK